MAERTCDQPDCDRTHYARGLCRMHYKRHVERPRFKRRNAKPCIRCGETFEPSRPSTIHCSTCHLEVARENIVQVRPPTVRVHWPQSRVRFPICRRCRRAFATRTGAKQCGRDDCRILRDCRGCGTTFAIEVTRGGNRRYCTDECRRQHSTKRDRLRHLHRDHFDTIARRDGWRCHICGRRVNRRLKYPHLRSGSVDHLVPRSDGGDERPENLRLAHLGCNIKRSDKGTAQLLLVG